MGNETQATGSKDMLNQHRPRHDEETSEPLGPGDGSGPSPDEGMPQRSGESVESPVDTEEAEREVPDPEHPAEDESADPVGNGHGDADLADRMPRP